MMNFDGFLSVLLPAPSPALPEAMAGATSMGGYLATARATQLVDIVRWLCLKVSLRRLSSRRAGGGRDMWFHHPSQALPLTATVPRLPNGMERKAGRAYRSVLDLVVATCTAALVGAMSVVPPEPRRVAGVVPSVSRPCPDVICTGESRRRQRSDVRPVRA